VFTNAMTDAKIPVKRTAVGLRFPAPAPNRSSLTVGVQPWPPEHAFDFETMADATFLRSLFASDARPHLLVQAPGVDVERLTSRIVWWSPAPLCVCNAPGPLQLPQTAVATLLIRDVSQLSVPQQIEMSDWMTRVDTQVVSVSSVSLRTLVESGRFLQGLFDRLSALQVNATRGSGAFGRAS
jgi:Sigma-54 interaction domain